MVNCTDGFPYIFIYFFVARGEQGPGKIRLCRTLVDNDIEFEHYPKVQ